MENERPQTLKPNQKNIGSPHQFYSNTILSVLALLNALSHLMPSARTRTIESKTVSSFIRGFFSVGDSLGHSRHEAARLKTLLIFTT
jgi:hypothetical protein